MTGVPLEADVKEISERQSRLETCASRAEFADAVDLWSIFGLIWRDKWLVTLITGIFAIASVVLALWLPNEYRATVILSPASTSNPSALSRLAGQFGGLASIAGVNISGDSGVDKSVVAIELVKTWGFLDDFINENGIQVEVFAATGWDQANNRLEIDSDLFDMTSGKWVRDFDPRKGETAEPTSWELYKALSERISIKQDLSTSLINLSVEYYSPVIAKEWVDKLVSAINSHLQIQDREEAKKSIKYLQEQIDQTSLAEMKIVFYQLIQEQTKNLMLAEISDEYVFKTLSPARVPEEKSSPRRAVICIAGTFIGLILAIIFAFVRGATLDVRPILTAKAETQV